MDRTTAIVVSYLPDIAVLSSLLVSLADQVNLVVLVDNGGGRLALEELHTQITNIYYIDMGGNCGLGAALNAGCRMAVSKGAKYIVTFDQDSLAQPTLIKDLAASMRKAIAHDKRCIAVSPSFYDRREGEEVNAFPFYRTINNKIFPIYNSDDGSDLISVDVLITSGMFIKADIWSSGIQYDEQMFVDFTDTEWCFRARSAGYTLYGCTNIRMGHALSDAPPVKLCGASFFKYSPTRRYFYFRNTLAVVSKSYLPYSWKKRLLAGLALRFFVNIIIDKHKYRSVKMMIRGIYHGFTKSLGPKH